MYILDESFKRIELIEIFNSIILSNRYKECGDFKLILPTQALKTQNLINKYIEYNEDVMIIEDLEESFDSDKGESTTITGRSLDSILDRRIIWGQKTYSGDLQNNVIKPILQDAFINSGDRHIDLTFEYNAEIDTSIDSVQFTGDNVLDSIRDMANANNLSFSIRYNNGFKFKMYKGEEVNVVFARDFDNLIKTEILTSIKKHKNVALIGGEGEGNERRYQSLGTSTGLARREMFVDARDISSNQGEIPTSTYNNQLKQRGIEKLAELEVTQVVDADIDATMYRYGVDYSIGDIVNIRDTRGISRKARITEYIIAEDSRGRSEYPSFEFI